MEMLAWGGTCLAIEAQLSCALMRCKSQTPLQQLPSKVSCPMFCSRTVDHGSPALMLLADGILLYVSMTRTFVACVDKKRQFHTDPADHATDTSS